MSGDGTNVTLLYLAFTLYTVCSLTNVKDTRVKSTWKLVANLIQRKTKGQLYPTRVVYSNKTFTNAADIAKQLNIYVTNPSS